MELGKLKVVPRCRGMCSVELGALELCSLADLWHQISPLTVECCSLNFLHWQSIVEMICMVSTCKLHAGR
jgi:hypothetical protein